MKEEELKEFKQRLLKQIEDQKEIKSNNQKIYINILVSLKKE